MKNRYDVGREFRVDTRIHPGQYLYRYMTTDIAYKSLGERKIWLADPKTWEDPHEAWWCTQLFTDRGHLPGNQAFGNCWTMRWRDEPFWRLQTTGRDGLPAVRVRVKARLLAEWFRAAVRWHPTNAKGFIGKVSYCPMDQLAETSGKLSRAEEKRVARVGAEALLMKRLAFEFEREVRLLWIDKATTGSPRGFGLAFDPNQLFDQIMIGPSKSSAAVKEVQRELVAMKVEDRLIAESKVWAPPAVQAVIEQRELQSNAQASTQEDRHRAADGTFGDLWVGW
jgi:hypothetical protein